ncbi:MAG: AAA family ATPase [Reyranella sp.]|uniref:adenylate/guanylate cyclase domain-containing protein n=1 Tax=Reyranella sp. TaxID=1929291 RepID=UPI0025FF78AF|nr:adenylate/guanylate cyclase domain-containing protein [Reyranella sp.]MBR2813663.1 AAA family ATPase [Reyranella sp.]
MLCRHCNSENRPASAFCTACGKPLGAICRACGQPSEPGSRFCSKCGKSLSSSVDAAPPEKSFLKVLSRSGGERKQLTLLFADIVDSMSLIERRDPEEAMDRIQPALDAMTSAVDSHGGTVLKGQGDGVMALFGAPRPHEDHALRACAAALAMQAAVVALNDNTVRIRVGLHTGIVVTQAIETGLNALTYDVAGPAAHLASRMEHMADAGEVFLTGDTVAATRQSVEVLPLGKREVRGLSTPIEMFRLLRVRHAPASVFFRSRPNIGRLIDRDNEFNLLRAELTNASNGAAHVVGVVGAAGVGKSRLCFEFAEACRHRGIRVHETRVLAHAHATPYQPVLELLRDYLGLKPDQAPEAARLQAATAISTLPVATETLPLLLDFLGLADTRHPIPRIDPAARKARLLELVGSLLRAESERQAAVILVEDLHWIDAASAEFIEAMVDAATDTATLLLFNFRNEYAAPWMKRSPYRQIALPPLDRGDMDDLLVDLLGPELATMPVAHDIADRAQGSPFFAEEMVHTLKERGDFEGQRGSYRLAHEVAAIPLPMTIEAVLSARIDRLDEATRRLLQCAAVIGREVPLAILESVSGLPTAALADPLERLQRAELLRELVASRPGIYAFCHPLIQEVCYQSLLRERRRRIHADVARALKQRSSEPWEERASLLAYHLEAAGETMEAAQATIRSAMWVGTHDSSQALRSWKKVHQLLATVPPNESTNWLRLNACLQIMGFGWREGLPIEEAQSRFEEAKALALATSNLRAAAWAHAALGRNLAVAGSADDYIARVGEAAEIAMEAKDSSTEVMLKAALSQALRLAGRARDALQANIEASERVREINEFDRQLLGFAVESWLPAMRGQVLVLLGRFDEARACLDRMLDIDADPHDITQLLASVAFVDLAWARGDLVLAERHAERASSLSARSGSPYVGVSAGTCRGIACMTAGRFAEAADELEKALKLARTKRAGLENEARLLADLANARRLNGDLPGAERAAGEALEVAHKRSARIPECLARIVLAEVALTMGNHDKAALELPRIQALLKETGADLYAPLVHGLVAGIDGSSGVDPIGKMLRTD